MEKSVSAEVLSPCYNSRMNHIVYITKSDGKRELFEENKLVHSLTRAGAQREVVDEIVDEVGKTIRDGMSSTEIYSKAFSMLHKHHAPTAVKYSIRRALLELGPDGFPFEKFVARIFRLWGYETLTDQTVMGSCIVHEVDIVAWKGDKLAMVEAKFHNEMDLKSDVKVVLYVKARFDDISGMIFEYGGTKMKLGQKYLITNTKFTDQAIKYSNCQDIILIGWNYPSDGNLHDIIEKNSLHPITCLTSLTKQEKKELIGKNMLVCSDLAKSPDILHSIGVKQVRVRDIIAETTMVIEQAK